MDDKEILEELKSQREWWKSELSKSKNRQEECEYQISKVNRLIGLLEEKIKV